MPKICEKALVCRIGCRTRRTPHDFFYGRCTCLHTARQKQVVIVSSLRNCCKVTTKKSQIFSLHFQTSFPTFRQIGPDCNSLLTEKQYKYRKIKYKPTSLPSALVHSSLVQPSAASNRLPQYFTCSFLSEGVENFNKKCLFPSHFVFSEHQRSSAKAPPYCPASHLSVRISTE